MTDAGTRHIRAAGASDTGLRRPRNEDALGWRVAPDGTRAVAVVADGVGGQPGGERASALVVDAAMEALSAPAATHDAAADLAQAFSGADAALHRARESDPEVAAMATTLIAAVADTRSLYLAHVGDSRAYLLHDGGLAQLTRDHTVAQQMVDDGVLKPEQRDRTPFAHVLARAMDGGGRTPEVSTLDWVPGDRLLLCSDGLNAALGEDTIGTALGAVDTETAVAKLVSACNRAGGPDNVTVIVLELF